MSRTRKRTHRLRRLAWMVAGIVVVAAVLYAVFGEKGREILERNEYPLRYPPRASFHWRASHEKRSRRCKPLP